MVLCAPSSVPLQMAAAPIGSCIWQPQQLPTSAVHDYERLSRKYGLVVQEATLPFFQHGMGPWDTMGFIAKAAKTFSKVRWNVLVTKPPYPLDNPPM